MVTLETLYQCVMFAGPAPSAARLCDLWLWRSGGAVCLGVESWAVCHIVTQGGRQPRMLGVCRCLSCCPLRSLLFSARAPSYLSYSDHLRVVVGVCLMDPFQIEYSPVDTVPDQLPIVFFVHERY